MHVFKRIWYYTFASRENLGVNIRYKKVWRVKQYKLLQLSI